MIKAHSEAYDVHYLVHLPKIDELYAILNTYTVYYLLDCTSGYNDIALSPEAQRESTFVTPIGKFEFKESTIWFSSSISTFSTIDKSGTERSSICFG